MNTVEKINGYTKHIDKILEGFAIITLVISVLLAFLGVILRYIYGLSYEILAEISTYSIVYGVFIYLAPLIKQSEHIKMNILHEMLKGKKVVHYVDLFISLLLFLTFVFLLYAGINWSTSLLDMGTKTLSGGMLLFVPALAIVIGMLLGILYSGLEIVKDINQIKNGEK